MLITIYGASHNLVIEAHPGGGIQHTVNAEGPLAWRGDLIAPHNGGQARVYGIYDGCWHFSVGPVSQDVPLPRWPITIDQEDGYSAEITIDAPDGTHVTNVWTGDSPL